MIGQFINRSGTLGLVNKNGAERESMIRGASTCGVMECKKGIGKIKECLELNPI